MFPRQPARSMAAWFSASTAASQLCERSAERDGFGLQQQRRLRQGRGRRPEESEAGRGQAGLHRPDTRGRSHRCRRRSLDLHRHHRPSLYAAFLCGRRTAHGIPGRDVCRSRRRRSRLRPTLLRLLSLSALLLNASRAGRHVASARARTGDYSGPFACLQRLVISQRLQFRWTAAISRHRTCEVAAGEWAHADPRRSEA